MLESVLRRAKRLSPWAVVLVISLALNVLMAQRIKILERALAVIAAANDVSVGDSIEPVAVTDASGSAVNIRYDDVDVPTMLYIMSPQCVWCQRNSANMMALLSSANANYRMFVLSAEWPGIEAYRKEHGMASEIYVLSPASLQKLHVAGTPGTLVISPDGKLLHKWYGAYDDSTQDELETRFGVRLPGLLENMQSKTPMMTPTS